MTDLVYIDIHSSRFAPSGDVNDYYNLYEYNVMLESESGGEPILIGKGSSLLYLCEKALNNSYYIMDAFDDNHHEDIFDILFAEDGCLKEEWEELFAIHGSFSYNILVSDRLEILPEYQHHGYGAVVRSLLRDFFSGCYGVEILHSFPLQLELFDNSDPWRSRMCYDAMEHDQVRAHESLNNCYRRTGYTQYQDSEYFYRFPSVDSANE